jgi:Protein of unknown function (DUF2934)
MAVERTPNTRGTLKSAATRTARQQQPQPKRSSRATLIDPERRRALIAEAAYFRAERRGFAPGHEAEDWLAAEVEVDTALTVGVLPGTKPAVQ